MGIWNTIGEVAATMGGDKEAAAKFHQPTADRQALAHEELEAKSKMIWDDVKRLQDRRAALDPKSPRYTKEIADIDASLHQHQQAFTDLYHPEKNPGALQHLGKFLKRHHESQKQAQSQKPVSVPVGTGPPVSVPQANIPTTPAQAKASMADLQASAAGPGATPPAPVNKFAVLKQQLKEALPNISEEDLEKAVKVAAHVEGAPGVVKPEATSAAGEPKPGKQSADERNRADFAAFRNEHPEYKGTEQRWLAEQRHLPKAPGAPKPERLSSAQNKAQSEYVEAVKLSSIADQVEQNPGDAINQKRLAVALERQSAGRFTTQALDYIIKSGWGNTIEQWALNPSTGGLPPDVVRQLVKGAHENVTASKEALDTAMGLSAHVPTTPAEAKKKVKNAAPDDDDEFLRKIK